MGMLTFHQFAEEKVFFSKFLKATKESSMSKIEIRKHATIFLSKILHRVTFFKNFERKTEKTPVYLRYRRFC